MTNTNWWCCSQIDLIKVIFDWIALGTIISISSPNYSGSLLSKAICNLKFVHRHPRHLDFCRRYLRILSGYNTNIKKVLIASFLPFLIFFLFTVFLDGIFAVEKYKLLLPRLVKNNMHQTNTYFCEEFLRAVYFQIKREKNVWRNLE